METNYEESYTDSLQIAWYMPSTVQAAAHQAALASRQQQQQQHHHQGAAAKKPPQQQPQVAAAPVQQKQVSTRRERLGQQANSNIIGHVVVRAGPCLHTRGISL